MTQHIGNFVGLSSFRNPRGNYFGVWSKYDYDYFQRTKEWPSPSAKATSVSGGTTSISALNGFTVRTFSFPGPHTFTTNGTLNAQILVVGGGGGGGWSGSGGGGGGGGIAYSSNVTFFSGTYTIVVGQGGAGGTANPPAPGAGSGGGDSQIYPNIGGPDAGIKALGGGGGGYSSPGGSPGGSGGGGGAPTSTPSTATQPTVVHSAPNIIGTIINYGNAGGVAPPSAFGRGGGGGGAGGVGGNAIGPPSPAGPQPAGPGGVGFSTSITGTNIPYGSGGGGAAGGRWPDPGGNWSGGGGSGGDPTGPNIWPGGFGYGGGSWGSQPNQVTGAVGYPGRGQGGGGGGVFIHGPGNVNGFAGGPGIIIISHAPI